MKKGFYLSGLLAFCFVLCSLGAMATVPTIHADPHDSTVCPGIVAAFAVTATDTPGTLPMTYIWQVSTDGSTWSTITNNATYSGTTTDVLNVTADTSLNGHWYRTIVTNTDGHDTSSHAVLTVNPAAYAGGITGASGFCIGNPASLSDSITGGKWSSTNTAVATIDSVSGTVTGSSYGISLIHYTYTNVCGSDIATYSIHVDTVAVPMPITGPTAVCVGSTITLGNINQAGVGVWSASNTSASVSSAGVVLGLAAGSVTITYDYTNDCGSVSSDTTIQVDTLLAAGTISGPTAICTGTAVHLSETVSGGIWISDNTGIAIVNNNGDVTGVAHGSATISYYLSNACGASIATHNVNVSRPVATILGGDSVGIGNTITLTDTVLGGTWQSSDISIATVDSLAGVVTGKATGTSTISYTVTNVCGTATATHTVTVGPAPSAGTVTGADSVCAGNTIHMSDAIVGGVWTVANDNATINGSGLVTGDSLGLDTAIYTVHNAFGTSVAKKKFYVNHTPVIHLTGPAMVALSGNYFFIGTPAGGTYSSSPNDTMGYFVSYGNNGSYGSYVVLHYGTDTIHYKVTNTCGTADSTFVISLTKPSIVNSVYNTTASLMVYPNPTRSEVTVNLLSDLDEPTIITITNIVGVKVKELTISTNQSTKIQLDQPAGLYILSATTASGNKYTAKITIIN